MDSPSRCARRPPRLSRLPDASGCKTVATRPAFLSTGGSERDRKIVCARNPDNPPCASNYGISREPMETDEKSDHSLNLSFFKRRAMIPLLILAVVLCAIGVGGWFALIRMPGKATGDSALLPAITALGMSFGGTLKNLPVRSGNGMHRDATRNSPSRRLLESSFARPATRLSDRVMKPR